MALADYVWRTREIIYGSEIGELPPIRIAAADALESVSGSIISFALATDEGSKVKAGHTLAALDATDPTKCYAFYVTGVSTDTITAVNGYGGTPAAAAGNLDSLIFEQNPLILPFKIHKAIDTVFGTLLYPDVFKFSTSSHTPDLSTYQTPLAATDMDIDSAWQLTTEGYMQIPSALRRNVHTTVSTNGVLGSFDYINATTAYVTTIAKLAIGDEDEDANGLIEMVSTAAAAICLGASISEGQLASSSKDSQARTPQQDVAARLWRDHLTLKRAYSEAIGRERGTYLRVDRG
jgi:hypothetical protein